MHFDGWKDIFEADSVSFVYKYVCRILERQKIKIEKKVQWNPDLTKCCKACTVTGKTIIFFITGPGCSKVR